MITISDIAKLANVSTSTVSNAFNKPDALSVKTRQHIFDICQQYGYRLEYFKKEHNDSPSTLIEFNILTAGYITYFTQEIIAGLLEEAAQQNTQILITLRDKHMTHITSPQRPVDGRILIHTLVNDQLDENVPTVLIGKTQQASLVSQINNHNIDIIYEATKLLIDMGHQHILFFNTDSKLTVAHERLNGFKRCLSQHGLVYSPANHHMCDVQQEPNKYIYQLLRQKPYLLDNMSAIICDSTHMAEGIYQALNDLGITVPDQISILSICRNSSIHQFTPTISYFDLRPKLLGRTALRQTLAMIQGDPARKIFIDHQFVSGGSIGYPSKIALVF